MPAATDRSGETPDRKDGLYHRNTFRGFPVAMRSIDRVRAIKCHSEVISSDAATPQDQPTWAVVEVPKALERVTHLIMIASCGS